MIVSLKTSPTQNTETIPKSSPKASLQGLIPQSIAGKYRHAEPWPLALLSKPELRARALANSIEDWVHRQFF